MLDTIISATSNYEVVLEPDQDTPEWWAGAPSVVRDGDGTFYLAARMREGDSPRGLRGYEVRILRSQDGIVFEPAHHIRREDANLNGFERPALVRDPRTGSFRLYGCCPLEHGWAIIKWDDADDPTQIDPATARVVVSEKQAEEEYAPLTGYKDPFVLWDGRQWHMFVIGCDFIERVHHFTSVDGEDWRKDPGSPIMANTGWHNFYTRPACVMPLPVGYLFVYEGSNLGWRDPVYNIATGLAYTIDLQTIVDLTPEAPLLKSTTPGPYHTWRYSHWLTVGDEVFIYFEAARPNKTNEIRLARLHRTDVEAAIT